jgi:prepilin-type N-terminal cleavage/methylation domain-containing protein
MSADRGFTLLEALVATALLAATLTAGYAALSGGATAGAAGDRRLAALAVAESTLERARGLADPASAGGTARVDGFATKTTAAARPDGLTLLRVEVAGADGGRTLVVLETLAGPTAR